MIYDVVDSTSTTAREMAEKGAIEWTVVSAELQTHGRGRRGNVWVSPKRGLWFSVVLRPPIRPSLSSILQLYTANVVGRALADETGIPMGFKWPNDLFYQGSKLGGVLVEAKTLGEKILYAIVGVGINLNVTRDVLPEGATSAFLITGKKFEKEKLLRSIVSGMKAEYDSLDYPKKVAAAWWKYCVHKSTRVEAEYKGEVVTGVVSGINSFGQLEINTPDGVVSISDGSIRIL